MKTSFPDRCKRCGSRDVGFVVSKFNLDTICIPCKDDERLAPGYKTADAAEVAACRAGDYNFPGVGLSRDDARFLAERLAARTKEATRG